MNKGISNLYPPALASPSTVPFLFAPGDLSPGKGNTVAVTDALGNTTYFGNTSGLSGYNIANQQILITYPATGQTGSGHGRMTMTYLYPGGPLTGEQNYDEGNTPGPIRSVATSYGMEGETLGVTGSTEPAAYTYDALYRLHSLTDGNNQTTYYFYNATGYRVQTVYPGGYTTAPTAPLAAGSPDTITNTTFDTIGQVTASVDGRGVTTTYTYTSDPESKLTNVHYTIPNGSTVTPLSDTVIQYDPYGRPLTVANGVTSTAYGYTSGTTYPGYDDADHVLNIQTSYLNSAGTATLFSKALSYGYYNDGSEATMGTPAGTFSYAYDGAGRPTSLTNPFSETTSWGYQNNNWLSSETLPNAVTATYTRNVAGEITDLSNKLSGQSTALSDFGTMTYDGVGNRTSVTASLPGAPATYSGTTSYGYDTRNELTQETRTGSGTGNYSNAFSYDSAENPQVFRSQPATGANTFSVDNQTTAFSSSSGSSLGTFGYDGNGNPTTYKGATLAFDPENRMTGYGSVLTNGYGPDDLRAWKQGASGATYFLYSMMNQPVCEFNASGTLTATNTYGHVGLVSRRVGSTSTFYTFDPQGSVAQRLNSSGGIVSSDTGDAFGSRATTGSGDVFAYEGQAGYYTDTTTGLPSSWIARHDERTHAMTITINAPAEVEAAITEKATRAGLSVSEYTLRALMVDFPFNESAFAQEDPARARREAIAAIESGYYAVPGAGSAAFLAERSEEARREEARFQADYGTEKKQMQGERV